MKKNKTKSVKNKIPRVNTLVKFDFEGFFKELKGASPKDIKRWKAEFEKKFKSKTLIYLGEITNMPQHGIYINADEPHEFYIGYHTDNFIELTEDEV